jgi:hypothetical protein
VSDHSTALVPIEAWGYSSPELKAAGGNCDPGLLAEALIYYERVLLNLTTETQWADLLIWLLATKRYEDFVALVRAKEIVVYDYSFFTAPLEQRNGEYSLWNVQDPVQAKPGTFVERIMEKPVVRDALRNQRRHKILLEALQDRIIEVKSDEFGPSIENARIDVIDPRRNAVIIQEFVDAVYRIRNLGRPPEVQASVSAKPDGTGHTITWNVDFNQLALLAGKHIGFHRGFPLVAAALSNRYLQSAATESCDLFLGGPIDRLVGDKLYETVRSPGKSGEIIAELKQRVEFPSVRNHVNAGRLDLGHALELRRRAKRFREWLQQESDRDRDAIVAYHNEVAKEAGYKKFGRKMLSLFGVLGGGAVGGAIGGAVAGPVGGAVGSAAGSGITFLVDLGSKIGGEWKPVIFGNWMRERVEKQVREAEDAHEDHGAV